MLVIYLLFGLFVLLSLTSLYLDLHQTWRAYHRFRRSIRPSWGSIRCATGVYGGWGRIEVVWKRPPVTAGGPAWFTGNLDCMNPQGSVRYTVVSGSPWPLNGCPDLASRESLIETQIAIDRLCDAAKIEAPLAELGIFKLPSGAPLMVRKGEILRSVLVGTDGQLSIKPNFAFQHHGGDPRRVKTLNLYVAWTPTSPDGSILFSSVNDALRTKGAPVPTARTSRVAPADARPVLDMPDAWLELRSLGRFFTDWGPWEVSLIRGSFPDRYEAEFGSAIDMVTRHPPPIPIVAANTTEEPGHAGADGDDEDEEQCPICLKSLMEAPVARLRRCGHSLHAECLKTWLVQPSMKRNCPLCNQAVKPEVVKRSWWFPFR